MTDLPGYHVQEHRDGKSDDAGSATDVEDCFKRIERAPFEMSLTFRDQGHRIFRLHRYRTVCGHAMPAVEKPRTTKGTRSAGGRKRKPPDFATTGGFQLPCQPGVGDRGIVGTPGWLARDVEDWPRNCHRTPRRRLDVGRGRLGRSNLPGPVLVSFSASDFHSQKRLMDYWGYRQPDFARCSTITVFPPVDAVGLVQVISSPLISARLFCFVPSQFGKLLPMTSKLIEPSELTA